MMHRDVKPGQECINLIGARIIGVGLVLMLGLLALILLFVPMLVLGCFLLALLAAAWRVGLNPWNIWHQHLDEVRLQRQSELEQLKRFHERLLNATSELLAQANDLDQVSKLFARRLPEGWSNAFGSVCSELVMLVDQTKLIEDSLQKREPRTVRELLLVASNAAVKTGKQLKWLKDKAEGNIENPNRKGLREQTFLEHVSTGKAKTG
jgi:hypothetical protein